MQKTITSKKYAYLINWLKKSRLDQGMTMRDLGEKLGEPHSFVQKIELMERRLDVFEYVVYCGTLGVDPVEGLKFLR